LLFFPQHPHRADTGIREVRCARSIPAAQSCVSGSTFWR
jgi:hypothetical protein